jgi:hypothetical protein
MEHYVILAFPRLRHPCEPQSFSQQFVAHETLPRLDVPRCAEHGVFQPQSFESCPRFSAGNSVRILKVSDRISLSQKLCGNLKLRPLHHVENTSCISPPKIVAIQTMHFKYDKHSIDCIQPPAFFKVSPPQCCWCLPFSQTLGSTRVWRCAKQYGPLSWFLGKNLSQKSKFEQAFSLNQTLMQLKVLLAQNSCAEPS